MESRTDTKAPFSVDVVYTWIDGRDPLHSTLMEHYDLSRVHPHAKDPMRFRDNGELRQSIRSVCCFAPWVRKIHVVCSLEQHPPTHLWGLPENGPEIVVIQDSELMDPSSLPTFNSHALEAHLYLIPDLSEHFIYMCDDMFFGNDVYREDFFDDDGHIIMRLANPIPDQHPTKTMIPAVAARCNNHQVLNKIFSGDAMHPRYDIFHQARPLLVSVFRDIWEHRVMSPLLQRTATQRFRTNRDLEPTGLSTWYAWHTGRAVRADHPLSRRYWALQDGVDVGEIARELDIKRPALYCLNDCLLKDKCGLENMRDMIDGSLPHHSRVTSQENG